MELAVDFERIKRKALAVGITLSTYNESYYLQGFGEPTPIIFATDFEWIKIFLDGYYTCLKRIEE